MKNQPLTAAGDDPAETDFDIEAVADFAVGDADRDDRVHIPCLDIAAFLASRGIGHG